MSTKQPFFSVIIPNYKTEPFLEQCLKSLINQTFENFEVIVVNDGSPGVGLEYFKEKNKFYQPEIGIENVESTKQAEYIFKNLVGKDARFKFITKQNEGQGPARNHAIYNIAEGQRIVFLDADDWLENDYLEKAWEVISNTKLPIIFYGQLKNYEHSTNQTHDFSYYQKRIPKTNNLKSLLVFPTWSMNPINYFWERCFLIENNVKYPETRAEDTVFNINAIIAFTKKYGSQKGFKKINTYYIYRLFENQTSADPNFQNVLFKDLYEHHQNLQTNISQLGFAYRMLNFITTLRYKLVYKKLNTEKKSTKILNGVIFKILTVLEIILSGTKLQKINTNQQ